MERRTNAASLELSERERRLGEESAASQATIQRRGIRDVLFHTAECGLKAEQVGVEFSVGVTLPEDASCCPAGLSFKTSTDVICVQEKTRLVLSSLIHCVPQLLSSP